MRLTSKTTMLTIGLLLASSIALADEVIITYHSGAVQQVPLLQPTEQIQQINYRKQAPGQPATAAGKPAPAMPPVVAPQQQPAANNTKVAPAPAPEPQATTEKIPIKIKWAQPKDNW